jgi:RimJ/RimL family protein N-acetyltransferase
VVAIAQEENRASTHIMEKLGMRYLRDTTHRGVDVVMYAVARDVGAVQGEK